MMRSRDDLPAPLAPSTPILAPGNIEMLMPRSTSRSGGWNLRRSRMVKMNCAGMATNLSPVGERGWQRSLVDDREPLVRPRQSDVQRAEALVGLLDQRGRLDDERGVELQSLHQVDRHQRH